MNHKALDALIEEFLKPEGTQEEKIALKMLINEKLDAFESKLHFPDSFENSNMAKEDRNMQDAYAKWELRRKEAKWRNE